MAATLPHRLLLALTWSTAVPSVSVASLQQPACEECIVDYVAGEDAGAYKDVKVDGCDGPCDCSAVGSPCFDPKVGAAMKVGSVEHQAACCTLCTATKDCAGWVIASGVSAGGTQDDKPFCWAKHQMTPIDKSVNRGHGTCAPKYSCSADWGFSFLVSSGLCVALYVGGGSVFGARTSGRAPGLRAHPHHSNWIDAAGLVSDGVAFARAVAQGRPARGTERQRGKGGGYDPVRDHSRNDNTGGGKQRTGEQSKSKRSQNKSARKGKSPKSAPSSASGSSSAGGAEAAENSQPAAPAVVAVAGTKAGDGGRW
jgi:hypothetical protein